MWCLALLRQAWSIRGQESRSGSDRRRAEAYLTPVFVRDSRTRWFCLDQSLAGILVTVGNRLVPRSRPEVPPTIL